MTVAQKNALEKHWPHYGLSHEKGVIDFDQVFARSAPLILEIGFGMGDALVEMVATHPDHDYIGIDVHRPGVGNLLKKLTANELDNVRVFNADAVEVLQQCIADDSLDAVYVFFPDPWHKRRHHKRRLIQAEFVQLIHGKLKTSGKLLIATDWEDYALYIAEVMKAAEGFKSLGDASGIVERPGFRPLTKFEKRGERLGHGVWDLLFVKL